jgi:hypothetical protein
MLYYLYDSRRHKTHREDRPRKRRYIARKSLKKSNELEAHLGLLDYRAGKVREIKSIPAFFRSLRRA